MASFDVNIFFRECERAYRDGRLAVARNNLRRLLGHAGRHPAILHLLGLVEKAAGDHVAALPLLEAAAQASPRDPQIANNLANLLGELGRSEDALATYARALTEVPGFVDVLINRALLLESLGRAAEARDDVAEATRLAPASVKAWRVRGTIERSAGDLAAAALAFGRAATMAPDDLASAHGAARVALERGAGDALQRYLALPPHAVAQDEAMLLGLVEAAVAAGAFDLARDALMRSLAAKPAWREGHAALVRLGRELGDADPFARLRAAAQAAPGDTALRDLWLEQLAADERFEELAAVTATALRAAPQDARLVATAAFAASETGRGDEADRLFAALPDADDTRIAWARHRLRSGDPAAAAALLSPIATANLRNVIAWAYLATAWRWLGDDRHAWLCDQPGLVADVAFPMEPPDLADLAAHLRALHRDRRQPFGQSIRAGTQTHGALFMRSEPILARARAAAAAAVANWVARLPAADARHPTLAFRDAPHPIVGSWSVRLGAGGRHVQHVHPSGWGSSAVYVETSPSIDGGRLLIGAPPAELGLDLPPIRAIEPVPGRAALFPSFLWHGTEPFGGGHRMTMAFDLA